MACVHTVTQPNTNEKQQRVTSLIEHNALPLHTSGIQKVLQVDMLDLKTF